jgi:hypothetical protein
MAFCLSFLSLSLRFLLEHPGGGGGGDCDDGGGGACAWGMAQGSSRAPVVNCGTTRAEGCLATAAAASRAEGSVATAAVKYSTVRVHGSVTTAASKCGTAGRRAPRHLCADWAPQWFCTSC